MVDNRISGVRPISSGVLQGSVLGPLLFLIYFRDIPSAVSSSSAMFADDTLVYTVGCNCHQNKPFAERACTVASDVSALSQWSKVWTLCLTLLNRTTCSFLVDGLHLLLHHFP